MEVKLVQLYNTLSTIETKGQNTKVMADCLRFLEDLINTKQTEKENNVEEERKDP